MNSEDYIAVDLDGTLAKMEGWNGPYEIGEPIPAMVNRVKKWLTKGYSVKIFTARASDGDPKTISAIKNWCTKHIGKELEVTCTKDMNMVALFDDKAIRVEKNTGKLL